MTDTRTFFYPATAECQAIMGAYPTTTGVPRMTFDAPNNTMGGYSGLLDISDYNGVTDPTKNILISPDAAAAGTPGITDLMPAFVAGHASPFTEASYLMRRTDFKDWIGVAGIYWRATSFIAEVDINPASIPYYGGFRDEAPNLANSVLFSPYAPQYSTAQGSGIMLKAIITDQTTFAEVVKDSKLFTGINSIPPNAGVAGTVQTFPRQVVQLNFGTLTPAEMLTMTVRVTTEQYMNQVVYPAHIPDLSSTIYRIGLTPDPASLRSSGKQSAALTTG